jgi:hypothetical protein
MTAALLVSNQAGKTDLCPPEIFVKLVLVFNRSSATFRLQRCSSTLHCLKLFLWVLATAEVL